MLVTLLYQPFFNPSRQTVMNEEERREMLSKLIEALIPKPGNVVQAPKAGKGKRSYQYKDKAKAEERRETNKVALRLSRISTALTSTAKYIEQDLPLLQQDYQTLSADSRRKVDKYLSSIEAKKGVLKDHFLKSVHGDSSVAPATAPAVDQQLGDLEGDSAAAPASGTHVSMLETPAVGGDDRTGILPDTVSGATGQGAGRGAIGHMEVDSPVALQPQVSVLSSVDARDIHQPGVPASSQESARVAARTAANGRALSPVRERVEHAAGSSRAHLPNPAPTKRKTSFAPSEDVQYHVVSSAIEERATPSMDDTLDSQESSSQPTKFRSRESFSRPGNLSGRMPEFDAHGRNAAPAGVNPVQSRANVKDLLRRAMFPEHF